VAALKSPYRSLDEPEPELLFSVSCGPPLPTSSLLLGGVIGVSLASTVIAVAFGATVGAAAGLAIFLGSSGTLAWRSRRAANRHVRLERVGSKHRLRVTDTRVLVCGPFTLSGRSRITDVGHYFLRLDVRGVDDVAVSMGAFSDASDGAAVPSRDDWFDGALLRNDESIGDYLLGTPAALFDLRDAITKTDSSSRLSALRDGHRRGRS
jgi:hypothetical protein